MMQIPESSVSFNDLANNFIFYKVMRHHPDACKHLIEMLLNIKIERMEMHNEEVIDLDHDSKGIRLDVFVKDINKMYDIEIQAANTTELPERSRYYQALMDLDTLKTGDEYKNLKDSHVIFICLEDIFKTELPVYTFEYICKEDGKTKLNDRTFKHFFIAKTCAKMIKDKEIKSFFDFLISNRASNDYTSDLNKYVNDAKHNMQWRVQYMTWERVQAYARDEGIAIGEQKRSIENAKNFLKMNILTPEQIAQGTGLTVDEVKQLAAEVIA
ncbi:MAG: Rpn family recombination-promoting nuclease/putative transposase [Treponema sp.]|nr:Rpn family recombination-promoting nuclease/putative transposase [Treponema sp.]